MFMDTVDYALYLEKKMVENFTKEFEKKMGYKPIVITKFNGVPVLSLEKLEAIMNRHIPKYLKIKSIRQISRKQELVYSRHMFCRIAKDMGYTLKAIGTFLNNRDHSTVIHSLTAFNKLADTDLAFREKYDKIIYRIIKKYNESSTMDNLSQARNNPEPVVSA